MTADADTPDDMGTPSKRHEVFSVYSSVSGKAEIFDDPRAAGRAFYLADPSERPSVTHTMGSGARTMARTEIHGVHPGGEPRYFKSLPSSHAPDAAFREGFLEAMDQSLKERLGKVAVVNEPGREIRNDNRLVDDLEAFAYRLPVRAAQLWVGHGTDNPPGPVLKAAVDEHVVGVSLSATMARTGKAKVSGANIPLPEKTLWSEGSSYKTSSVDWER